MYIENVEDKRNDVLDAVLDESKSLIEIERSSKVTKHILSMDNPEVVIWE